MKLRTHNSRLKIAFVAPFGLQPKGTVSARMMPLAHALAARGHMVRVVIPPWDDPSARNFKRTRIETTSTPSGGLLEVVTLPLPGRLPNSLVLTYGLVRWTVNPPGKGTHFRAEVVHVFKPVGYSGLAALVLQALGVPWVLDMDDWEGPGGWADTNPYSLPQKVAVTLLEASLPRVASAVTAASRTLEARAWGFGLPPEQVLYLPNGVSKEKYASWASTHAATPPTLTSSAGLLYATQQALRDDPVILLYTRFAEFPYAWPLRVLEKVLIDHPTAKLLVVGTGFFQEEEKLRQEAARTGLGGHVIITGRLPEADLPLYLALADVALYPMRDNLINRAKSPMKVLEQMLMGLPIVAHNVGQVPQFLGDTGILVEPGDLKGMAEATSMLLSKPELRRELGQRAQASVWAEFNWEKLSEVAERSYAKTLESEVETQVKNQLSLRKRLFLRNQI
ncbi:MAG TPA: glycosyltransferase family 4 protein [Chloroflexia bacterium]|nr:glycosyltransferase family 4 protein [Chloroflexia bacterium]